MADSILRAQPMFPEILGSHFFVLGGSDRSNLVLRSKESSLTHWYVADNMAICEKHCLHNFENDDFRKYIFSSDFVKEGLLVMFASMPIFSNVFDIAENGCQWKMCKQLIAITRLMKTLMQVSVKLDENYLQNFS